MGERQYHTQLAQGDAGRYVLLPGDPFRVPKIASYLDNAREVAHNREYMTYTGTLLGEKVSVCSTGIGGPSTAIAVEELMDVGVDTFIRVGTCGGMQQNIIPGDIVIATAAIRAEGTSREYMPIEFPAAADFSVLTALDAAARSLNLCHHTGIVQCKDSFFGQHAPDTMPVRDMLNNNWRAWIEGGCLASEMESAALFIVASVRRLRAGSVFLVAGNIERTKAGLENPEAHDTAPAIACAVEAIKRLIVADRG